MKLEKQLFDGNVTINTKEKFMMQYITKEEEVISIPENATMLHIDTINGMPTVFFKIVDEENPVMKKVKFKFVGPQDSFDSSKFRYVGTIKMLVQLKIQTNPNGPNFQETPLNVLISDNIE